VPKRSSCPIVDTERENGWETGMRHQLDPNDKAQALVVQVLVMQVLVVQRLVMRRQVEWQAAKAQLQSDRALLGAERQKSAADSD
jgi:hypothetical protein